MNFGLLLRKFGTTVLRGVRYEDWRPHLEANRGDISPEYRFRAASTTAISRVNSVLSRLDERFLPAVRDVAVEPPLFILGQPRSGTTYLHQLLAADEHFAFANLFQVHFPNHFLTTERYASGLFNRVFHTENRGIDNVVDDFKAPGEGDWAVCNMCCLSPNLSFVFPNRADHYDRYLSFRDATPDEAEKWKAAYKLFVQKVTWKYRKPLVLKSPQNTCRIKLLLDLFPDAKFVHIHRHPFDVFKSVRGTVEVMYRRAQMYEHSPDQLDDRVIWQYRHMFDVYQEEQPLIRPENFTEIGYDFLAKSPMEAMERIYSELGLTHFEQFRPRAQQACKQRQDYKRNRFPEISAEMQERLAHEWAPSFDAWGYEKRLPPRGESSSHGGRAAEAAPSQTLANAAPVSRGG